MTQTDRVLAYLRSHPEGLTQADAWRLGLGSRLAARICEARWRLRPGESITAQTELHIGGRHARYRLTRSRVKDEEVCE